MKIKQLKIKNIASLKGNHVINFDEILNDLNLFAITGPTGSGKSTILSCIGLVLYGDHYKKSLAQSDFVTLGESKGKIDLYFHFQNREYLAKWEAAIRKKNGEPLKLPKIKRTLFVKDNDEFVPIEKNIQDIIHLNFDQFCKTVILNQGEFSKFLTSNFRERKEILEKLYQGHYLELVGQKLKEELSLEQQKMEVLDSEIQAFKLSATEDITSLKIESQQKSKQAPFIEKLSSLSERIQKALFDIWDNKQKEQKTTNILQKISYDLKEQTNEHGRIKTNLDSIEKEYEIFQNSFLQKRPLYQECLVKKNLYQEKEKELLKTQQKLEQYFKNKEKIS